MTDPHYGGGHRFEQEQNFYDGVMDKRWVRVDEERRRLSEQYRMGVRTEQINGALPLYDWKDNIKFALK